MKTKLLILSFLLLTGMVWGQEKNDNPCKATTVSTKMKDSKKEAEKYAKKYKLADNISTQVKEDVEKEYTELQQGYNKVYRDIKNDIASGFLFVGENSLCKTKYYAELIELDKKTQQFLTKKRVENNKSINKMNAGLIETIIGLISVLEKVYKAIEDASIEKADKIYEKLAWKTYEEL